MALKKHITTFNKSLFTVHIVLLYLLLLFVFLSFCSLGGLDISIQLLLPDPFCILQ